MILIERHGTEIRVKITCSSNGYTYFFNYECGQGREDYAILLRQALFDGLSDHIKEERRVAYNQGYADAKAKRRKETWFSGSL